MLTNNHALTNVIPAAIISTLAIAFGYWFGWHQINAVANDAFLTYPAQYFFITIAKCCLTIFAFFTFSHLVLSHLTLGKVKSTYLALSFLPLALIYLNYSLFSITLAILVLQFGLILLNLNLTDYKRLSSQYLTDFSVLVIFFLLHTFLSKPFSPLHWDIALVSGDGTFTEEIPVLSPLFRGFLLAKQFSFSYVDHSQWAGIMNPAITLASPLMQLIVFIFDIPSIDMKAFHSVLAAIFFSLLVLGSFGFYLFLKYAAKLSFLFAVFGGFLFCFSGAPFFVWMFYADGGVLLSSYVVFVYALLAITLAFEKNSLFYAIWAGVALASQFFILTPHPEGVIYSFGFYIVYTSALVYYSKQSDRKNLLLLSSASVITFLLLSAYSIVPILYDKFIGNMYVFAHTGDIKHGRLADIKFYFFLFIASLLVSRFMFRHSRFRMDNEAIFSRVYSASVFTAGLIIFMMGLTWITTVARFLAHKLHVGIHFWYIFRPGMYYSLFVYVIFLFILEAAANACTQLFLNKTIRSGESNHEPISSI